MEENENLLHVDYIYLTYEEKKKFAALSHDYFVAQLNEIKERECNMIMWTFICKYSNLWSFLPFEIQSMVLNEL